jgi:hypothetical protein
MAEGNKTVPTSGDVDGFLAGVSDDRRREDAQALVGLLREVTGEQPTMWGTAIVGFGRRHHRYESGREADSPAVGFAPRKAALVLYLGGGLAEYEDLLSRLGNHRTGKGCLYVKQLGDVDLGVLRLIAARSYQRPDDNPR